GWGFRIWVRVIRVHGLGIGTLKCLDMGTIHIGKYRFQARATLGRHLHILDPYAQNGISIPIDLSITKCLSTCYTFHWEILCFFNISMAFGGSLTAFLGSGAFFIFGKGALLPCFPSLASSMKMGWKRMIELLGSVVYYGGLSMFAARGHAA
ncbi:hypothetical protein ACJX0J_022496, partial [Zea mays]